MLVLMEVALGIDNLVFIGILTERMPPARQKAVWRFWYIYSPTLRAILLLSAIQLLQVTFTLFKVGTHSIGIKEALLIGGGLFLIYKAVKEIHQQLEAKGERVTPSSSGVILQVALIDFVFSSDSVLTAIGMSRDIIIMLIAILVSLIVMIFAARQIQRFISEHPTMKMLALAFLLLIGFTLTTEGVGIQIPKGYIYFAMLFSLSIELLNMRAGLRSSDKKENLKEPLSPSQ
ncbi:MAG: TerC family protein [Bacteroidia bacterium]|nr:TerC family protein [Bacteroidia bacterium]